MPGRAGELKFTKIGGIIEISFRLCRYPKARQGGTVCKARFGRIGKDVHPPTNSGLPCLSKLAGGK